MNHQTALEILKLGYNSYLTGPAGSGKTYLLNKYIEFVNSKKSTIALTAPTGIAATHIGGITLDSWSGIGNREVLNDEEIDELAGRIQVKMRYLSAKTLVIDEISMVSAGKLDCLDKICRRIRNINTPFGGLQVVLCGDFFQLPPVSVNRINADFAYKSRVWNEMDLKVCYLSQSFRQKNHEFLSVLHAIREGKVDDKILGILAKAVGRELPRGIIATKLFTHNVDVEVFNYNQLTLINDSEHIYPMEFSGIPALAQALGRNCLAPEKLVLKKGAVVMFVKNNFREGYVNGSMGKVIKFDREDYPVVEMFSGKKTSVHPVSFQMAENNIIKAQVKQVPLRLAWAITVHKSQGMTLDAAEVDLSKSFLTGMGYVALSRVKSLAGLRLLGLNEMALQVSREVVEIDNILKESSKKTEADLKNQGWLNKIMQKRKFVYYLTS